MTDLCVIIKEKSENVSKYTGCHEEPANHQRPDFHRDDVAWHPEP